MSIVSINEISKPNNVYSSTPTKITNPRWDVIPHKGMERPTEAEFEVIIDDLAKALAEARYNNDDNKYNSIRAIKDKVYAQYVSAASPDRKALAKDAMQLLSKPRSASSQKSGDEPKTLIDYLNMRDGIGQTSEGRFSAKLKSGTMIFTGSDLQPNTFELKVSPSGQSVMGYNPNGWAWTATPGEKALSDKFLKRINAAEDSYYRQFTNYGIPDNAGKKIENADGNSSIDIRA